MSSLQIAYSFQDKRYAVRIVIKPKGYVLFEKCKHIFKEFVIDSLSIDMLIPMLIE